MSYIFTLCIGGCIGFFVAAIISSSGYEDKIREAYNEGYKRGLKKNKG